MKLVLEVPDADAMTAGALAAFLARSMGWTRLEASPSTPRWGFRFREGFDDGQTGEYDVVNDEITWDDGRKSSLFRCDSPDYCGESLAEMLDVPAAVWCEDEDGNPVLAEIC